MLKVISNTRFGHPPFPSDVERRYQHTSSLPTTVMTPEAMLAQTLRSPCIDESCASIVETYASAGEFALKLTRFFTTAFPSSNSIFENALCEILDTATVGYLRIDPARGPKEQLAKFLSSGVLAAASALMCYRTSQRRQHQITPWEPWEDGALSDWIQWGGAPLEFCTDIAPTPERRYATRIMLQQRLLRFKDTIAIARAGIDLQSMDMF